MEYLIEARHERHGNNWDSDYCGNHQELYHYQTAMKYLRELVNDPEWGGWEFRVWQRPGDGNGKMMAHDVNLLPSIEIEEEN